MNVIEENKVYSGIRTEPVIELRTMFTYETTKLKALLDAILRDNSSPETWSWLNETALSVQAGNVRQLNGAFAAMPRKTGKKVITINRNQESEIAQTRSGFTIHNWTIDRLSRVWLLMNVNPDRKGDYLRVIENLFQGAEMNEQVALYSSLPVFAFAEEWKRRCVEGIRSNIGIVLEAIMCDNPYPSENLDEPSWNQLVLKAFFTEKPVHRIIGLDARSNQNLANILSDYAHERWAAHRPVNPQLWRCVAPFINDRIFPDIERIVYADNTIEREAAALACQQSDYPPARNILKNNVHLRSLIEDGTLTWETLAVKAAMVSA